MTIHHDKLAYGKLASSREDISEEKLKKMLERINGESDCPEDMPEATDKNELEANAATLENDKKRENEKR